MALKWMATTDYNTDNGSTEIPNARLVHFMRMYSNTASDRPRVQSEDVLRIPQAGSAYSFARTNRSLPDTYDFRYRTTPAWVEAQVERFAIAVLSLPGRQMKIYENGRSFGTIPDTYILDIMPLAITTAGT